MNNSIFIFPGQGSQKIGMGKDFYDHSPIAKEMIEKASQRVEIDFTTLLFEENDRLDQTEFAQPAILLVSLIAHRLFVEQCKVIPKVVLGHSLGEFSALSAASAMDYLDAVELVHQRGLLMKKACEGINAGMMALLGLDDATVENLTCKERELGKKVWAANYNGDGQIVIAGNRDDLVSLESLFKEAGAKKSVLLPMSVASHCPLLSSAQPKLEAYLDQWLKESFAMPIISNVTASEYQSKVEAKMLLSQQLISPVKYKQSILYVESSTDSFIEFGGSVLKGLNKRITQKPTYSITDMKSLEEVLALL
ncbi:ACP S-malonyltransferase [Sulfurospirillum diekertiae]|uniref:Malonyl CoA-acyl carrier protein transacylase n=1 Tax=Sulfurospirillum diekertiae TaxID=1854492 RepID=A0A1Y0HI83_9BACT|nr:ACP S-malonyltransferase [Sulfurospirillum diekertiae]ARU47809.1 Malonyl CoA-acyl carrier protein transacylase [Sulfurospirillum diekertiae]ASC92655.1 Malonyl CoA-acyl carrier protein transacylase [Sulfurospirillum diekertiae]